METAPLECIRVQFTPQARFLPSACNLSPSSPASDSPPFSISQPQHFHPLLLLTCRRPSDPMADRPTALSYSGCDCASFLPFLSEFQLFLLNFDVFEFLVVGRGICSRGFQENSEKIQIHTDRRSHKVGS